MIVSIPMIVKRISDKRQTIKLFNNKLLLVYIVFALAGFAITASAFADARLWSGPDTVLDESLHLTFDGKPGPFLPSKVGQKVKLRAWFLGRPMPLDKCKITFQKGWAKLDIHYDGKYGWLTVKKLDVSGRDLGPENRYSYKIEFNISARGETKRGVTLTLDSPYSLHELAATVKLPSGKIKDFNLRSHPDIYPVSTNDVYVWPSSKTEVVLFRNKLWIGMKDDDLTSADTVTNTINRSRVVLVAVKLKQKSGGTRWLYTNFVPFNLKRPGWDDEASKLRLPVFSGSSIVYRDAARYFKAKGVPFDGLSDISHIGR